MSKSTPPYPSSRRRRGATRSTPPLSSSQERKEEQQVESKKKLRFTPHPYLKVEETKSTEFSCFQGNVKNPNQYEVMGVDDINRVNRCSKENDYILRHNHYSKLLTPFLEQNLPLVFDELYTKYRDIDHTAPVYRPTDDTRNLIVEVVKAGIDLHDNGSFHGHLIHPENIGIRLSSKNYNVVLVPENKSFETELVKLTPPTTVLLGRANDRIGLTHIVFKYILRGVKIEECAPDIQHLYELMSDCEDDFSSEKRWLIVDHISLRPTDERMYFCEKIWQKLSFGGTVEERNELRKKVEKAAQTALERANLGNWKERIPNGTPIRDIYDKNSYGKSGMELLRFHRKLGYHRTDPGNAHLFEGIDREPYKSKAYFEMRVNHMFPLFLCYLHEALIKLGVRM